MVETTYVPRCKCPTQTHRINSRSCQHEFNTAEAGRDFGEPLLFPVGSGQASEFGDSNYYLPLVRFRLCVARLTLAEGTSSDGSYGYHDLYRGTVLGKWNIFLFAACLFVPFF